jgi:hypothetical protein
MRQFAGMLLALSAGAGQPGHVAIPSGAITTPSGVCQTRERHKPAPKLVVTITPSKVKIDDTSKQGTPLAKVAVRRSNGSPYTGKVTLTKNPGGICRLVGLELQLGRDTTKADDYTTSECTVTASE